MELRDIKGIGEKRILKLAQAGIHHPLDLLLHFPYKYADLSQKYHFATLREGQEVAFIGTVASESETKFVRKGLSFVKVKFSVGNESIGCTWFNQRFVAKRLVLGKSFCVMGKIKKFRQFVEISAPVLCEVEQDERNIIPLYRPIHGLPQTVLSEALLQVLKQVQVNSYLTPLLASKHGLMPLNAAFHALHRPQSMQEMLVAARTIAVENLSNTLTLFSVLKRNNAQKRIYFYSDNAKEIQNIINSLPFQLTADQEKALLEIVQSFHKAKQTNRLLQGDVGCGKTIVALLAMYYAKLSGYQSAMMAPTELLARQHYANALKIFEKTDTKIVLITGAQSKTERDNCLFFIKSGMADMVIGTHAILEENVVFAKLSLVITDEQHRFGVNQRGGLENKSIGSDRLVMSATPIPRTLALTVYGDLEQSVIRTLPRGKAQILTRMVPERKTSNMLTYIEEKAKIGEQSYLVCPRILEEEDDDNFVSAEVLYKKVAKRFSPYGIAMLHGQMRESEKTEVMNRFARGGIKILVTTTIVEVGIDVAAATTMVIFNADRYGLSQLHQLRGRVGRGKIDSYCFLLTNNENLSVQERLQFFCGCTDGFELAEYDFKMRGAGDFIGTKQHGDSSALPLIPIDADLIQTAKAISEVLLLDNDICDKLTSDTGKNGCEFIKSLTLN